MTNGEKWNIYKVIFSKPIEKELVYSFNMCELNIKKQSDLEMLYYISSDAFGKASKSSLDDLHNQKQILNKFIIGQVLLSETCVDSVRKYLKKISPEIKVTNEELLSIISTDIFKREIIEGDEAINAKKKVAKMEKAILPKQVKKTLVENSDIN